MIYHIWSEGYRATGERATAKYYGEIEADSFDKAVKKSIPTAEKEEFTGDWYVWGCKIFDNEADARRSFG